MVRALPLLSIIRLVRTIEEDLIFPEYSCVATLTLNPSMTANIACEVGFTIHRGAVKTLNHIHLRP